MGMLLLNGSSDLNPRELFANNEQGLWLDPSDMTAGKAAWRRNLLTYSEQFDRSPWTGGANRTVTANTVVSPDGLQTGDRVVISASGAIYVSLFATATVTENTQYTFSYYLNTTTSLAGNTFRIYNVTGGADIVAVQNCVYGGGWIRQTCTFTTPAGCTSIYAYPVSISVNNQQNSFFEIWGAQLELGSTPTEYQPITDFATEFKQAFPTHTLYQDSSGVTPCTAAGDPVGLILDQSRGGLGALGLELVTNGGFDADTNWTKGSGWTITGGKAVATNVASFAALEQFPTITTGKRYLFTFTVSDYSSGEVYPYAGGVGFGTPVSANGTYRQILLASGSSSIAMRGNSNFTGTIDNISVRELPGNHAYQTTSASRPTLARIPSSGRRNLLTRTEEFDNAAWTKYQSTISPNATTAPDGTSTADSFVDNAVTQEHTCYQFQTTTTATFSVYAKANARSTVGLRAYSNLNEFYTAIFDLQNGVVSLDNETGTTFSSTTSSITSVGSGWYRCSISYTRSSGTTYHVIDLCNSTNPTLGTGGSQIYLGNGTGIFIWGAQLETGSSATNYQKVVATTDVTESGVSDLWHLVFDGADDFLTAGDVCDIGSNSSMIVVGGSISGANGSLVAKSRAATGAGRFGLFRDTSSTTALYSDSSSGRTASFSDTNSLQRIYSSYVDRTNGTLILRVNATQQAAATPWTPESTSHDTTNRLLIGAYNNSTDTGEILRLNGAIFQVIVRQSATPTGKLLEAERFVARKTGVTGI